MLKPDFPKNEMEREKWKVRKGRNEKKKVKEQLKLVKKNIQGLKIKILKSLRKIINPYKYVIYIFLLIFG